MSKRSAEAQRGREAEAQKGADAYREKQKRIEHEKKAAEERERLKEVLPGKVRGFFERSDELKELLEEAATTPTESHDNPVFDQLAEKLRPYVDQVKELERLPMNLLTQEDYDTLKNLVLSLIVSQLFEAIHGEGSYVSLPTTVPEKAYHRLRHTCRELHFWLKSLSYRLKE